MDIEVTVKHRIGVDDMEDYSGMANFVETIANTGCKTFVVHARKAWLKGLSPKENREVPPLKYDMVHQLKREFPELDIVLNGGLKTLDQCLEHLPALDGVMVGREAYSNPYLLAEVDGRFYNDEHPIASREEIAAQYIQYCDEQIQQGQLLKYMSKHVLGLFQGLPGARRFRRHISENAHKAGAGISVLEDAVALVGCNRTAKAD